ncbi:MAG: rod shape-determining protein MreC [Alphaproteobacteria bacterium]|nr:rod shape-determining protein MreC [Alphaproteobacteria bacterium]
MENKFFRLKKLKAQVKLFAPVLFLIIALGLIGIGVSKNPYMVRIKNKTADAIMPVVHVIGAPVRWGKSAIGGVRDILTVYSQNKQLREENQLLIGWKNTALKLAADKKELEKALNYVPSKEVSYLTARIMADTGGTFARTLIVQAGSENGLKKGAVAVFPEGMLGRIVEVGTSVSRLLELTDYTSRIPVMVGKERFLCILTGDNTDYPKLISIPEGAEISVGDRVITSGHAGVFPSGIAIGTVISVDGEIAVQPYVNAKTNEFVRLVDFGLDDTLIKEETCECPADE